MIKVLNINGAIARNKNGEIRMFTNSTTNLLKNESEGVWQDKYSSQLPKGIKLSHMDATVFEGIKWADFYPREANITVSINFD